MKVYGAEAPWVGREAFGSWRKGPELWDGTIEWTYVDPSPRHGYSLTNVSDILRNFYLPPLREAFEQESVFLKVMESPPLPLSRAAQHARWKRLPWWRRLVTRRPR